MFKDKYLKVLLPVILALFSFEVYFNSLSNDFVYDDNMIIKNNENLKYFKKNFPSFFNINYFKIASSDNIEASYRPISTFSYYLNYAVWKLNPAGYRLFNLFFHILNVVLLYFLMNMIMKNRVNAFVVSLFFLSHPVLTETMNSVTYNEDIFALFFMLLTFITYIKMNLGDRALFKKVLLIIINYLFYFLGLLSKEMVISLPVIILVYDVLLEDKKKADFKHLLRKINLKKYYYLGYAVVSVMFMILTFVILKNPDKIKEIHYGNLFERIIFAPYNAVMLIRLIVFPFNLNADHPFAYPETFFDPINLISYFLLFGIILTAVFIYKRSKFVFFGIFWFLITLTPVLNIFELYNPIAERYLYIPAVGFCIAISLTIINVIDHAKTDDNVKFYIKTAVILIIVIIYAFMTTNRNRVWKNDFTLWSDTVKKSPDSARVNLNYAIGLADRGRHDEAEKVFLKTISLNPKEHKAFFMLGTIYLRQKNYKEAEINYLKAIEIKPDFPDAYNNLGVVYANMEKYEKAIDTWNIALTY
ncbi:MAG: tetratricopeptide repeat protein, partial [Spirochaetes bacterium]|nr:tetratricopeptide repeat protein [Spirochaetota bacterium]